MNGNSLHLGADVRFLSNDLIKSESAASRKISQSTHNNSDIAARIIFSSGVYSNTNLDTRASNGNTTLSHSSSLFPPKA